MKFKQFIKAVVFLVLLPIIILPLDSVFSNLDYRTRQIWEGFYAEPEGSLDAVIIGASNVYPY
ncbi:MAG: SGNH/GDSL hydrolase family protein, partial [Clostridiales bacterium]|nr:SGNH/GDSL hydrolase family protein [Clostridiales bacterium]